MEEAVPYERPRDMRDVEHPQERGLHLGRKLCTLEAGETVRIKWRLCLMAAAPINAAR
jgi:hypothetical protein